MRRSFEQQTADAIRILTVVCVVLAVGLAVAIGLAAWGFSTASSANRAVGAGLKNQTSNRARNVGVWCGAINQGRAYDRAFVRHVTRGRVSYRLPDLPCRQLERKTINSTR